MPSHPHTSVIPRHAGRIIDLGKDVSLEQRARHQRSSARARCVACVRTGFCLTFIRTRNVSGLTCNVLVGLDGCEVRLCVPCFLVRARVSHVCPGSPRSFYRYRSPSKLFWSRHVAQLERHAAASLAPTCVLCTSVPWHICRLLP